MNAAEQSASEIKGEINRLLAEMDEIRERHSERMRSLIEKMSPGVCYREILEETYQ